MVCLHQEYTFNSGGFPKWTFIPEDTNSMGGIWKPYLEQVNSQVSSLEKKELGVNQSDSYFFNLFI